jgi:hypothetical protein
MSKPRSLDLRERVVASVEAGASRYEAAERFEVSGSSAIRWVQRYVRFGSAAARAEAERTIEHWNRAIRMDRDVWWSPTIVAGTPWLDVYCPGCNTSQEIDIRKVDRHPLASVGSLVLGLRCTWCPGSAPMPKITGLNASPPPGQATGAR